MLLGTAPPSIILRLLFTQSFVGLARVGRFTHHIHVAKCVCPISGDVYAFMSYESVQLLAQYSPSVFRDYSSRKGSIRDIFTNKYFCTLKGGHQIGCIAFKLSVDPFGPDTTFSLDIASFIKFFNLCLLKSRGYVYRQEHGFFGPKPPPATSNYGIGHKGGMPSLVILRTFKFHKLHINSIFWYNDLLRFV
jgi:hypothetical protein